MYERFTDRARRVMQLANQEAQRFNHEYIGTEHILLGLVREGSGAAANVLKNLDVDLRKIRIQVERIVQSASDTVIKGKILQTPRAKKVIEYAIEEARDLNFNYVGTENLLLGLLREQEGVAAQVLMNLNLRLEEVREEVLNLLGYGLDSDESSQAMQYSNGGDPTLLWSLVDPDSPLQEDFSNQIDRLGQDKEEAEANQEYERAAAFRNQANRLKKQASKFDEEWRKSIKRFQNHPFVRSYRAAIIDLNSRFPNGKASEDQRGELIEALGQCSQLKRVLHQLYQRLEVDPHYGMPNDTISQFTLEVPWFVGRCMRPDVLEACLRTIYGGRRVILVGMPGSGRKTLARFLARSIFQEAGEFGQNPMRLVGLNHCALDGSGRYGEALAEILAALRANGPYLLSLDELHLCVQDDIDSPEFIEAWRLAMLDCLEKNQAFVAWTTPLGIKQIEAVWPKLLRDAVVLRLDPIPDKILRTLVVERIAEIARSTPVAFSDGFIDAILEKRGEWKGGEGLSDPGLILDFLAQTIEYSLAIPVNGAASGKSGPVKKSMARSMKDREARPSMINILSLKADHILAFVHDSKGSR